MAFRGIIFSTILTAGTGFSQTPPTSPAGQAAAPVILKSTTRLVQVSVIVQRHGQPVADLKKEDFEIKDNGKLEKISAFSVESTGGASTLPRVAKALPPGIFTNELEQQAGTPGGVTIILLDNMNTNLQDQVIARHQVIKYLQTIKPEDRIGIYAFGNGLKVLHDYTTDSSDLIARLGKYRGENLPDLSASEPHSMDPEMVGLNNWLMGGGGSGAERDFYTINRVQGTLKAIEFIANNLANLPGRKNLVWVSGGFPLDINMDSLRAWKDPSREQYVFNDEIDRCVRAVNNANLAIYPVDARGLETDHRFDASNQRVDLRARPGVHGPERNQQTMNELASRTGGKAFYNRNDLDKAIASAVDDAKVVYTIGFYPTNETFDGKFHKLEVKTPETSGVNLRYRKGYFDTAEAPSDEKAAQTELRDAVWSPLDATGTALVVAAKSDLKDPKIVNIAVQVEAKSISLEPNGERWNGRLDILIVQKNDKGQQFDGKIERVELNLTRATYDKVVQSGFIFRSSVAMNPQAKQVRVIVRDAPSGTLGSITVPFSDVARATPPAEPR